MELIFNSPHTLNLTELLSIQSYYLNLCPESFRYIVNAPSALESHGFITQHWS